MNVKPALLVTALAAAALVTVGCEQRSLAIGKADVQPAQPAPATQAAVTPADDTAITAKVKAAMLAEPGLKSLQINVDTKDATVTLTGNVDSDMLRDRAKQIAMSTEGVRNVVDNLSVRSS